MQSGESDADGELLVREILTHLVNHPDAKDTVDGIQKFWLSDKTSHESSEKITDALECLVETKGWLSKKALGPMLMLYSVNKDRIDEIQDFLRAS